MTEPTPDPAQNTPADPAAQPNEPAAEPADTTDWKAEARKWETRAKENNAKAAEFEKARKAAMTEAERATVEAEERGYGKARSEYGSRLAQTEFRAAAAARNSGYDVAKALAYVDLSKFLAENGEPDTKAIEAAVNDLVPEASGGLRSVDVGQGPRGTTTAPSMSQLIRKAAGRA